MVVLKSMGVMSCAKIMGATYAAMGLIFGALASLISVVGAAIGHNGPGGAIAPLVLGVGAVIFLPIFYGVVGFVGGAIGALIYNFMAGVVGGVELDLQLATPQQ